MAGLLERLTSRLGDRAVLRPRLQADAQPELACEYDPWLSVVPREPGEAAARPLTRPPVLRSFRPETGVLSCLPGRPAEADRSGADRDTPSIARRGGRSGSRPAGGVGTDIRRDYYVAETAAGERFWVFRGLAAGGWFLHGVFD